MESKETVGLADYASALRRRRRLAVYLGLPIFICAIVVAVALPSVYQSAAIFKLKGPQDPREQQARGGDSYVDRYITGLTEIVLRSDSLNAMLDMIPPPNGVDRTKAKTQLVKGIKVDMVTEKILDPESGRERIINTGFKVSVDSRDPYFAWHAATSAADAFVRASREYALSQSTSEAKFFASEADRVRARIANFEAKLADFKSQNFNQLPESAQANLNIRAQVDQELSATARELSTVQQNRIFAAQQLQQAQMTNNGASLAQLQADYETKLQTYSSDHPDMIALRHQIDALKHGGSISTGGSLQAQLQTQEAILAETRQHYSDDHPDVKRLSKSIATLEARIAAGGKAADTSDAESSPMVAQLRVQVHALDSQIAALQSRAAELRAKRTELDSHLASTPEVERDYQAITRDLGTARAQYDQLMNHRMESDVKSASIMSGESDKFALIQPPSLAERPAKPARLAIGLLGLIASIVAGFMGVTFAEAVDPSVRGARDVRLALSELPLSIIPKIRTAASRRQRSRQAVVAGISLMVAVPVLFVLVRLVVH
jgi:succinoglycan biosynthesis transport protein ExoP